MTQPTVISVDVELFDVNSETRIEDAKKHLEKHGYVVYSNVISPEEISIAKSLLWDHLESLGSGINRNDVSTWDNDRWPEDITNGVLFAYGIGQSSFLWFLRDRPNIEKIFRSIWSTSDLLVSFDGCGVFRPRSVNAGWTTKSSGWYHFDQNGCYKQGNWCYQGLINLLDAGHDKGGLVICPWTHLKHTDYFVKNRHLATYPDGSKRGDFVKLREQELVDFFGVKTAHKLCAPAGSFVVWNSTLIHCNTCALVPPPIISNDAIVDLERIVAYICMMPRPQSEQQFESLMKQRKRGMAKGETTSHWATEYVRARKPRRPFEYRPIHFSYQDITPQLNPHQLALAGITPRQEGHEGRPS